MLLFALAPLLHGIRLLHYAVSQSIVFSQSNTQKDTVLVLSSIEFVAAKTHANEMRYQGKWYDLQSVVYSGDKVHITATNDTYFEQQIETAFAFLYNHKSLSLPTLPLHNLVQLWQQPCFVPTIVAPCFAVTKATNAYQVQSRFEYAFSLQETAQGVSTPPPEHLLVKVFA